MLSTLRMRSMSPLAPIDLNRRSYRHNRFIALLFPFSLLLRLVSTPSSTLLAPQSQSTTYNYVN